jgi:hypothetical protein
MKTTIKPETLAALPENATLEIERTGCLFIWRLQVLRNELQGWPAGYRDIAKSRDAFYDGEKCFRAGIRAANRHGYSLRSGAGDSWSFQRTDLFERWAGKTR